MSNKPFEEITAHRFYPLVSKDLIEETLVEVKAKNIKLREGTKYNFMNESGFEFPAKDMLRVISTKMGYLIKESSLNGGDANKPFLDL